jgi:hypothetical protein
MALRIGGAAITIGGWMSRISALLLRKFVLDILSLGQDLWTTFDKRRSARTIVIDYLGGHW